MALRYFKSGATVWNSAASWSSTSSAGVDSAGVPNATDDVIFDAGSGSCNVNVSANCLTIDFTGYSGTMTMTNAINIAANGTITLGTTDVTVSGAGALATLGAVTLTSGSGGSWGGLLSFITTSGTTKTLSSNFITRSLTISIASTLSGSSRSLTVKDGTLTANAILSGDSTVVLNGATWTGSQAIRTNLTFDSGAGTAIVNGSVSWTPLTIAATLKYTSGGVTTSGSTLTTGLSTTAGLVNFDTSSLVWNNITFSGVAGAVVPVLVSDLRCSGLLTNGATGNFTPSGTGAIRAGSYSGQAGAVITLNTDWYISSLTFNALVFNTNKVFVDTLLTPINTTSVLGGNSGSTTEFVMTAGSIVGLGAASGWNVPVTISPTTGNTVTASGGIRIGINVARTLKFDTAGGGTINTGSSTITFGLTNSILNIDLSGAGSINLNSCTILNSGAGLTISVTSGSASFNSGTSTLNISTGGTTLNTQGISWFNITTAAHTHTLNSSLVSIGTFQMNAVSTFTNGNLYWDPQGTLSLGTGAVGFTFSIPRTVTVQNLILNSAGGGSAMILNNNSINVTGNLTMIASATASGTTQINLVGTGTWSNTGGATTWLRNPVTINTSGTITLGASVSINNTTTYSAGTIDSVTNSNTLNVLESTLVGFGSTSSSYLNNLTFHGGTSLTINTSAAYFLGTVTTQGNTSFAVTSSSTFGFSTNILNFLVTPTTHTFKALTEYFVRGQLNIYGRPGVSTTTVRSSSIGAATRTKITLLYGATQKVFYTTTSAVDSSGGQTVWDYKGTIDSDTINWRSPITPGTISSTFAY